MTNLTLEKQANKVIPEMLSRWLGGEVSEIANDGKNFDFLYKFKNNYFLIEFKGAGTLPIVDAAIRQLQAYQDPLKNLIRIVAVPYMGDQGREHCRRSGIYWMDLSGNAEIQGPNMFLHIEGKPNQFKTVGRPKNVFAPKSSRVTRYLLANYQSHATRRDISIKTGLNESLVGRVVRELAKKNLVSIDANGKLSVLDPDLLLEAWRDEYDFAKHRIIRGFVAQRSGEATLNTIAKKFESSNTVYAATGLAGAWLLSNFAMFRLTTIYVREFPDDSLLQSIGFREQATGNVWLTVPNDEGVLVATRFQNGISCVHPIQVYLDLKGQPERSQEAAKVIKDEFLRWNNE